jgi:hypothetical protein
MTLVGSYSTIFSAFGISIALALTVENATVAMKGCRCSFLDIELSASHKH